MPESGYDLNLHEFARKHFRLSGRVLNAADKQMVNEAMRFASKAIHEYQRLVELQQEQVRNDYLNTRRPIAAAELVQVVELARSLRGRPTTSGDLWAALTYLLDRNLAECDWQAVLDELETIAKH
jgi:hypothetical protein